MTSYEQRLIEAVCDNDSKRARLYTKFILQGGKSQKDQKWRDGLLKKLEEDLIIPANLDGVLVIEKAAAFQAHKFFQREDEMAVAEQAISAYNAAQQLQERNIPFTPAVMLYGQSGCGKTELAKYIAYKAELPFVYVRFSALMDSLLGATQQKLSLIFNFVRSYSCVLCFDEIDAIGMARGQRGDVGEMNRIVISMMQEMDHLPNDLIIVGTTNRYDRLDEALKRRFPIKAELFPLSKAEAVQMARQFFEAANLNDAVTDEWYEKTFVDGTPASSVITECTQQAVAYFSKS